MRTQGEDSRLHAKEEAPERTSQPAFRARTPAPGTGREKVLLAECPARTDVHGGPRTLARAVEPWPPSGRMPSTSYTVCGTAARTGRHQEQM